MAVFKAYDIRGIYGKDLDEELYSNIAKAISKKFKPKTVVVGRDMRNSGVSLSKSLIESFQNQGISVIDIGMASTPMLYQASADFDIDIGIIITASHNGKEYNGMKICKKNAVPVSWDSGIKELKEIVEKKNFNKNSDKKGDYLDMHVYKDNYVKKLLELPKPKKKFKIVFDAGNGMGGFVDEDILRHFCEVMPLYTDLDGTFPNHEANPIKEENLKDLMKKVKEEEADLGIAFDGDSDRAGFVDEKGNYIGADLAGTFLIEHFIKQFPKEKNYSYDLRSSKVVQKILDEHKKKGHKTRVGHSFIKENMRENNSFFSSELSGHFYFWSTKDAVFDSAIRAAIEFLNALSEKKKTVSEIIKSYRIYEKSPEINFEVEDKAKIINKIKEHFKDEKQENIDGITIETKTWWANIRESNTENILRLNLEADNKKIYDEKLKEIENLIQ